MITDKQKQKDFEYDADYKTRSPYSQKQWVNILNAGQASDQDMEVIREVYSSYNHAANLLQLAFKLQKKPGDILDSLNSFCQTLGEANDLSPELDYDGNEYWWYLCFWGKNIAEARTLELKMQPELTEAVGEIWPELEQAYYAFVSDVDRSLQERFTEEDSVWIAAAVLLYEKYYQFPGITADDILLMQYEVQTRAQKVFGQDVDANIISRVCNADERGHRLNYLRDIYKYYRVSFPGEFEGDRERPDPKDLDYNLYVYSIYGYMTLNQVYDFIEHEYAHLVDESYVELNNANGFVRLADFLTRKGGTRFDPEDSSEQTISLKADGEDAEATFHMLADALLKEYPNFTYAHKASWYLKEQNQVPYMFYDQVYLEDYKDRGACISFVTLVEGDAVNIEISLNLPYCNDEEAMLAIQDKCNMLTLMTSAAFVVETRNPESYDLDTESLKIKASVVYAYSDFITMKEEDIVGMMASSMEIFASYYTDICLNYYPAGGGEAVDPMAAALGDKLVYRQAPDTPGPQIIYKEGAVSATTDFVTRAIQGYGQPGNIYADQSSQAEEIRARAKDQEDYSDQEIPAAGQAASGASPASYSGQSAAASGKSASSFGQSASGYGQSGASGQSGRGLAGGQSAEAGAGAGARAGAGAGAGTGAGGPAAFLPPASGAFYRITGGGERPEVSQHPDRVDQSFRLYPKNTLIKGPVKTAKYHKAILTAVGIIEGKAFDMISIEPVPDILEHYKNYVEEGRILQISCPDINGRGYEHWIESARGGCLKDGIFKSFANSCGQGRYVVMMEDVDLDWNHLFGETTVLLRENRREGTSSETTITLPASGDPFKLPSNLYIVATCDSVVGEDTILGAVNQDFFIRHVNPEAEVLSSMRVEGISLEKLMKTLNLRISYFLGPDYQLGEGFFLASPEKDPMVSLGRVFREQIIPLLEKWFDEDIEKIRYVLGDNGKTQEDAMFYRETPFKRNLFRGQVPDSFDTERIIYQINEKAFFRPQSYIEIYQI